MSPRARVKVVPPPSESPDRVFEVWRAVPLVPEPEGSCCARLVSRTSIPSQDEAREWLTFLRGLGLVDEGERGFHRERVAPEAVALPSAFREGVFGVERLLELLAEEPLTAAEAYERFEPSVPRWERSRHPDWRDRWRERVERLLSWAALLGLAVRDGDRYRVA